MVNLQQPKRSKVPRLPLKSRAALRPVQQTCSKRERQPHRRVVDRKHDVADIRYPELTNSSTAHRIDRLSQTPRKGADGNCVAWRDSVWFDPCGTSTSVCGCGWLLETPRFVRRACGEDTQSATRPVAQPTRPQGHRRSSMAGKHRSCSREDSRQARKIAAKKIYPFLGADPSSTIPPECPLHPELDMYKHQEVNKALVHGRSDTFQCGYCQKQFKTEFYMDRHMDNKHADRLHLADPDEFGGAADADTESSGHCLGDLCPALGCGTYAPDTCTVDIHAGGGQGAGAGGEGGGRIRRGCGMCDPIDMERRRHQCEALFRRCFDTAGGAAGPNESVSDSAARGSGDLYGHFVWQFCEHLACDDHHRPYTPPVEGDHAGRRNPLPGGGGTGMGSGVGMGMPKVFLIAVVMFGLIIFYASMALGSRSRSTRNDLRPAKRDRGRGRGGSGGVGGVGSGTAAANGVRGSSGQLRRRARPPLS